MEYNAIVQEDFLLTLVVSIIALSAIVGMWWYARARSRARWKLILDTFADREIARARRNRIASERFRSSNPTTDLVGY